ncbi:MAG TPA: (Fe-S)-binding protein [Aggregatilineales bacterium]|nr:(Fe-S)-binding protein [Anaerolineales bacterium]HRE47140.1 (Fe-S)-binding protein [Aggregatilineales bacterium]
MLSVLEKLLFVALVIAALGLSARGFWQMYKVVRRGEGTLNLAKLPSRTLEALNVYLSQRTTLRARPLVSLIHLGVVWGFTFYFLVNVGDALEGFLPDFKFLGTGGLLAGGYRLIGDLLSVVVLLGVIYFLLRRFVFKEKQLTFRENVLLHPNVKAGGIRRDSLIVGGFILLHVGSRFLGQSVQMAHGIGVGPQPFATALSGIWGTNPDVLKFFDHFFWWSALGLIVAFLPYFPYTKHAHLFMAPLNFLTRPQRTSLGEMEKEDLDDETKEQFGAARLEHLSQTGLVDAFACIMCNRCQDVCPAYTTGKELSPSALEINKRFMIKEQMAAFAGGAESKDPLVGFAISESAVWACTSCGACVDICPVGNEPMLDILDIRRDLAMVQASFPGDLKNAFNGMERQGNPWQLNESRLKWAEGLDVPTTDDNPNFEILYWVGCAAAFEPRAQQTARSFVQLMRLAGVNFAVLGDQEACTGDTARRAGREDLYQAMAETNVETLNGIGMAEKRIVTMCPHCLHNIGKEYHQFGGNYTVIHSTELIEELITKGRLPASAHPNRQSNVTFHDPCYLGRQNDIVDAPRSVLEKGLGVALTEMPRHGKKSFCCGAGGAQFWKEEEHGDARVNLTRYTEAKETGAAIVAVGCPFCMRMFSDAKGEITDGPEVKDVVELIWERLEPGAPKN